MQLHVMRNNRSFMESNLSRTKMLPTRLVSSKEVSPSGAASVVIATYNIRCYVGIGITVKKSNR